MWIPCLEGYFIMKIIVLVADVECDYPHTERLLCHLVINENVDTVFRRIFHNEDNWMTDLMTDGDTTGM